MQITLNLDRGSFCFIGQHAFTYGEPGPKEIDIETLSDEERKQLLYNIKRGTLIIDDDSVLSQLAESNAAAISQESPRIQQRPVQVQDLSPEEAIEKDLEELKTLLKDEVATVKKEATSLRPARARKLLELERDGKARKSVVSFLEKLIDSHASIVTAKFAEELEIEDRVKTSQLSTQLTDIVESEEEQVTINPAQE